MADETYGFTQAKVRLEEIVTAVRKKDTSLEKSLDLLEEGVRLANQCTELIDHADWEAAGTGAPIVPDAQPDESALDAVAADDMTTNDEEQPEGSESEQDSEAGEEVVPTGQ